MRCVIMRFCVFVFVAVAILAHNVQADDDDKQQIIDKLEKSHADCQKDSNTSLSKENLGKVVRGENLETSVYEPYITCVSKKLNTQNAEGNPNWDEIKRVVSKVIKDEKEADDFLKGCSLEKPDRLSTAKEIYICFHNLLAKYA